MVPSDGLIVEVGCGTGELARDWLSLDENGARYLRIDRAPALLSLQARNAPSSSGLLGDAVALPIADESVTLLLSNEVLADLPAVPWSEIHGVRALNDRIEQYGLST